MKDSSYEILKAFFKNLDVKVDTVNLFFHPDEDGQIIIEYNDKKPDIFLPELDKLIKKSKVEFEDKYKIFKNILFLFLKN